MPKRLPIDIIIIDVLAVLLSVTALAWQTPFLRESLGLVFALFSPGYILLAALYPGQKNLRTSARLALSLGLSIVIGVFMGMILAVSPWGFTLNTVITAECLFILAVSVIAWRLRNRTDRDAASTESSTFFISQAVKSFRTGGTGYRVLVVFLLCAILGGIGAVGYILGRPLPAQTFSEFYILGTGGKAADYPRELQAGEEGKVILGIVNQENAETVYSVRIAADGTQLYELTGITLAPGEKWEQETAFMPVKTGAGQKIEFQLYRDGLIPVDSLYILVDVKAEGGN